MADLTFMCNAMLRRRAEAALESLPNQTATSFDDDPLPHVVAAGDAIEAMLADFLINRASTEQEQASILKQDLKSLIDDCEDEGGISLSTKHLCHGVREMRNLVHPTRAARTGQVLRQPHLQAAIRIALLVWTELDSNTPRPPLSPAELLWRDLEWNDVLELTLSEAVDALPRAERVKLLLEVIPAQLAGIDPSDEWDANIIPDRAWHCATAALPRVSKAVRRSYWDWLAGRLREIDLDDLQVIYFHAAFIAAHLNDASKVSQGFLVAYVISYLRTQKTVMWPTYLTGIGPYLKAEQADPFVRCLARSVIKAPDERRKAKCRQILTDEANAMADPLRSLAAQTLDLLVTWCEAHQKPEWASELASIRYEVSPLGDSEIPR